MLHLLAQLASDMTIQGLLLGSVVPLVYREMVAEGWNLSRRQKVAIALALCGVFAVLPVIEQLMANGTAAADTWGKTATAVYASAAALYQLYFRGKFEQQNAEQGQGM